MTKPAKAKAPKGYVPPNVKQIMRWQVSPAAKVVAYFIRLNRSKKQDATKDWRHAPIKQLREEVGPATTSEQVDSALNELSTIGALEAVPKLGVQLSPKEKRKGRSYRLHRPGQQAYKVKPKTTRRVKPAQQPKTAKPEPPPAQEPKLVGIDPKTGASIWSK